MSWLCLLVMLLVSGGSVLVSACPEGCVCRHEQGLYTANCSSLPYSVGKVEMLTFLPSPSHSSPLELSEGQFNTAKHLKYLSFRNSSIYFVHKKAFYGAKHLVEIDLSFNYIEELDPTMFQHLTSLATLLLRGNPLQLVLELPFLISNSLQHLDIGHCKLKTVPRGIFYGLKRLRYLSMDGNFLKSLKYNSLPKGLKYLNLSQNLIVNVPTEVLSSLTNLRRIGLSGNPINCSCSLMNLQDWLSGRGVIFDDDVICALPSEYYGISWSKVDENRLCLAETRKEEISHSTIYNPLFKNRLYRENYFENENSYLEENVQSDQPQPLLPDSQAEVLFQNDDTFAMGEMMRDEDTKSLTENEQFESNKDAAVETDEESVTISQTPANEKESAVETVKSDDIDIKVDNQKSEQADIENRNEETILSLNLNSGATHMLQNGSLEAADANLQEIRGSHEDNSQGNKVEDEGKYLDPLKINTDNSVEITETISNSSTDTMGEKNALKDTDEEHNVENVATGGNAVDPDSTQLVSLNGSDPVVYRPFNEEESNTELDDFKKEGLFHVGSDRVFSSLDTNNTLEESTAIPDTEDTTEDEIGSTPETLTVDVEEDDELGEEAVQNFTRSSEINNSTSFEDNIMSEQDEVMETVPPPIVVPDLFSTNETHNVSVLSMPDNEGEPFTNTRINQEDKSLAAVPASANDNTEEIIKEVAGAEVVMFCIAVILICLILYSVYKCRTSTKRQSIRIVKDMESNRGTEMQDMASLLPKPQDDDKKNNSKYPDKAPSSETMKLLSEQNENGTPNFTPADAKKNVENKNALNNNTPSSPTIKTPLIKPGNPITMNPAAPIQRTKVKVGIIPDSIPRTPIFLQKTFNNGTKNV